MSDRFRVLIVRGAAVAVALMLSAACTGDAADDRGEPSDAATPPNVAATVFPSPDATPPSPIPTPTETPTGPDDEGWAEHLGLTEEELEQRRASDDFLEFAKPRRAREHPRFDSTHGNLGLRPVPGDGLDVQKGQGVNPLNPRALFRNFLLPFRDSLLAEELTPVKPDKVPGSDGSYVSRAHRQKAAQRQIFVAVAFYKDDTGEIRGRVAMAAANVNIIDSARNRVELKVVDFDHNVADALVGDNWSDTWREQLADEARAWGKPREFE